MAEQNNATKKPRANKKKATNSFRTYIHKVLKQVHVDSQISSNTIEQLDEFIKILARRLAESARLACTNAKKSTVGLSEIKLAVNIHLPGALSKRGTSEMIKAVTKFNSHDDKEEKEEKDGKRSAPVRRETQAGLTFAVALCEKFIRSFGTSDLNVSKSASVALAAVLEYITAEILELAGNAARDSKKVIINIRHVYLAVYNDEELTSLANAMGVEFLGGGVLPGIRPEFLPSKEKRQEQASRRRKNAKKNPKPESEEGGKKQHKYLPGTKALMEIRKYQKSTDLLLRKLPFSRAVRKIAEDLNNGNNNLGLKDIHFGSGAIEALQGFVEARVTTLCKYAVDLAIHGKRDGVNSDDIKLAWKFIEPLIPYTDTPIEEVGDNGLERLAYKGGVKRKGSEMYTAIRCYMFSLINAVIFRALHIVTYRKVITLGISDLKGSFASLGFHVTIPTTMGKPKSVKKSSNKEEESTPNKEEDSPVEVEV